MTNLDKIKTIPQNTIINRTNIILTRVILFTLILAKYDASSVNTAYLLRIS